MSETQPKHIPHEDEMHSELQPIWKHQNFILVGNATFSSSDLLNAATHNWDQISNTWTPRPCPATIFITSITKNSLLTDFSSSPPVSLRTATVSSAKSSATAECPLERIVILHTPTNGSPFHQPLPPALENPGLSPVSFEPFSGDNAVPKDSAEAISLQEENESEQSLNNSAHSFFRLTLRLSINKEYPVYSSLVLKDSGSAPTVCSVPEPNMSQKCTISQGKRSTSTIWLQNSDRFQIILRLMI